MYTDGSNSYSGTSPQQSKFSAEVRIPPFAAVAAIDLTSISATADELIPSGETSSFRSNPLGLAEFTLSRRDPEYVGRSKEVDKIEKARVAGEGYCLSEGSSPASL